MRLYGMCGRLKKSNGGQCPPYLASSAISFLPVQAGLSSKEDFHVCRKGLGASRHFARVSAGISSHPSGEAKVSG
jgi:hypothetical protein